MLWQLGEFILYLYTPHGVEVIAVHSCTAGQSTDNGRRISERTLGRVPLPSYFRAEAVGDQLRKRPGGRRGEIRLPRDTAHVRGGVSFKIANRR